MILNDETLTYPILQTFLMLGSEQALLLDDLRDAWNSTRLGEHHFRDAIRILLERGQISARGSAHGLELMLTSAGAQRARQAGSARTTKSVFSNLGEGGLRQTC